ncbi:MAG: hypothetical protein QNJ54_00210 [Prochloraceae cyanobacterium]|nr:hypothetical protein [Prochloraceae cyanobacterium]
MTDNLLVISQAAKAVVTREVQKPSPDLVVEALLTEEKSSKKNKQKYNLDRLIGNWRLCFITGTKKTRDRAGIVLGAGRYVPNWVKITISYHNETKLEVEQENNFEAGWVENLVEFGPLKLCVSGPIKLLSGKYILAFDFTRMTVELFGFKVYSGYIRDGQASEENFYQTSFAKQASFFVYFLVTEKFIAARGKGGGLAIWGKD